MEPNWKYPLRLPHKEVGMESVSYLFFFLSCDRKKNYIPTLTKFWQLLTTYLSTSSCQRSLRTTPYAYLAEKKLCILWFGIMYFWHVDKIYQFLAKEKILKNNEILACPLKNWIPWKNWIFMLRQKISV